MAYGVEQERQLLQTQVNNISLSDKYLAAKFDNATSPKYYGFTCKGGLWYIMRETITGDVSVYDYTTGTKAEQTLPDFETAWTGRAALTYISGALVKIY